MVKTLEFKKGWLVIEISIRNFGVKIHWTSRKKMNFIKWCLDNKHYELLELKEILF